MSWWQIWVPLYRTLRVNGAFRANTETSKGHSLGTAQY